MRSTHEATRIIEVQNFLKADQESRLRSQKEYTKQINKRGLSYVYIIQLLNFIEFSLTFLVVQNLKIFLQQVPLRLLVCLTKPAQ